MGGLVEAYDVSKLDKSNYFRRIVARVVAFCLSRSWNAYLCDLHSSLNMADNIEQALGFISI